MNAASRQNVLAYLGASRAWTPIDDLARALDAPRIEVRAALLQLHACRLVQMDGDRWKVAEDDA